jgi:hypothetical protein
MLSAWRGKLQMILRTWPALSSAATPVSPLPALLFTMVRSRAPWAIRPSISSSGMPAVPKPPISTVAPSDTSATASAARAMILSTMDALRLLSAARPPPLHRQRS